MQEDSDGEDTIKEENEDVDEEELLQQEQEQREKAKNLGKSERFSNWLEAATTQLDDLTVEVDSDCPLLVHPREVERMEELRRYKLRRQPEQDLQGT